MLRNRRTTRASGGNYTSAYPDQQLALIDLTWPGTHSMPEQDDKPLLTQFLADRTVTCPRCGYNLRGVASSACPECGDRLQLQVGLVSPRMAAYITTLVGISVGLGGSALFGCLAAIEAPSRWWGETTAKLLLIQLFGTAAALTLLLLMRRRFRRSRRSVQWVICVVTCLAVLALSIAIVVVFDD